MNLRDKVQAEVERRGLQVEGNTDSITRAADVFYKRYVEPHNGVLNSIKPVKEAFIEYLTDSGYSEDAGIAGKIARQVSTIHPELTEDLNRGLVTIAGDKTVKGLPQEGVTAKDPKDYPNDVSDGDAEVKHNQERANKGKSDMAKEKKEFRQNGPTHSTASIDPVKELRNFSRGYAKLASTVNMDLAQAAVELGKGGTSKAHKNLKKAVRNINTLLPELNSTQRAVNQHLKKLTAGKVAAEDKDNAIGAVEDAVELLLESVDEAKRIEQALSDIRDLADSTLPEDEKGGDKGKGENPFEKKDDKDDKGAEDLFGKDDESDEAPEEDEKDDKEAPEEDGDLFGAEEDDTENDVPMVEDKDKEKGENPFEKKKPDEIEMMVKGFTKKTLSTVLSSAYNGIKKMVQGSSEVLPEEQRAFNTTVKDYPNESTYRGAENSSNEERKRKDESNRAKEQADPDLQHFPGKIQDVRKINASLVPGKTYANTAIIVTASGEPVMKVTYANAAGPEMEKLSNFETFISEDYRKSIVSEIVGRGKKLGSVEDGFENVRAEVMGTYVQSKKAKEIWAERITAAPEHVKSLVAKVESLRKTAGTKIAGESEKSYYTKAYGDAGFAGELTKGMDKGGEGTKEAALIAENEALKTKEALRVKASRALGLATKISNLQPVPMSNDELKAKTREIMAMEDNGFNVLSSLVQKMAERAEPGQLGIVHNNLMGVEEGLEGRVPTVSDQDGLLSEIESDAKNPQSVVTPPDVQASLNRLNNKPTTAGVIPQISKNASTNRSGLDMLSDRFTCTRNRLKSLGLDEREIKDFEHQVSRRIK